MEQCGGLLDINPHVKIFVGSSASIIIRSLLVQLLLEDVLRGGTPIAEQHSFSERKLNSMDD